MKTENEIIERIKKIKAEIEDKEGAEFDIRICALTFHLPYASARPFLGNQNPSMESVFNKVRSTSEVDLKEAIYQITTKTKAAFFHKEYIGAKQFLSCIAEMFWILDEDDFCMKIKENLNEEILSDILNKLFIR